MAGYNMLGLGRLGGGGMGNPYIGSGGGFMTGGGRPIPGRFKPPTGAAGGLTTPGKWTPTSRPPAGQLQPGQGSMGGGRGNMFGSPFFDFGRTGVPTGPGQIQPPPAGGSAWDLIFGPNPTQPPPRPVFPPGVPGLGGGVLPPGSIFPPAGDEDTPPIGAQPKPTPSPTGIIGGQPGPTGSGKPGVIPPPQPFVPPTIAQPRPGGWTPWSGNLGWMGGGMTGLWNPPADDSRPPTSQLTAPGAAPGGLMAMPPGSWNPYAGLIGGNPMWPSAPPSRPQIGQI